MSASEDFMSEYGVRTDTWWCARYFPAYDQDFACSFSAKWAAPAGTGAAISLRRKCCLFAPIERECNA